LPLLNRPLLFLLAKQQAQDLFLRNHVIQPPPGQPESLPLVADALLGSLELLAASCRILARACVSGIEANVDQCNAHVHDGTAALTALVECIGHAASNDLSRAVAAGQGSLRDLVVGRGLLTIEEYNHLTSPGRVNQLGHRSKESE